MRSHWEEEYKRIVRRREIVAKASALTTWVILTAMMLWSVFAIVKTVRINQRVDRFLQSCESGR